MTKDELFAQIQKEGLIAVPVIFPDDGTELIADFDGQLQEFLLSAKAIGSKAVFVQDNPLEDEDFYYNPDTNEDEDDESDSPAIDLKTVSIALAKFEKYIGRNHLFWLVAKGGIEDLQFTVEQDWVADFQNEKERAEGKILINQSKAQNN